MNGTSGTVATQPSLSRSSSRTRPTLQRSQSSRSQPQPCPPINTSVPTTYSRLNYSSSTQAHPGSHSALQSRQASSSSVASVASSHSNTSMFSNVGGTVTTATSSESVLASTSTGSSCYGLQRDYGKGGESIYSSDRATDVHANGHVKTQDAKRPLSPSESLGSIGEEWNTSSHPI